MKNIILTDAMDVLFCGFTDLETLLSKNSGISAAQLKYRIHEKLDDLWALCRGEITETSFWQRFVYGVVWESDDNKIIEPHMSDFLQVFRDNMRRSVPGTFELYQMVMQEHGVRLFLASDHFKEVVPQLISWHPEVFRAIPESNRFWSCDIGLVKRDPDFFPYVLNVMEKSFGIDRENIVFVDDSQVNVEVARRNGISAIHFKSPEQLNAELWDYNLSV